MTEIQTTPPHRGKRILLIEDNGPNRQLLAEYLEHCGYEMLSLPDGDRLFESLESFQPHLILLDLKLPGVDGYGLLQQLQCHAQWCCIPVIVVSAFAFEADRERALQLGARHYIVKPLNLSYFRQVLAQHV